MARKSLGTLTLDLIAKVGGFEQGLDKASRKSQKTSKNIEKHANQIGQAFAAASAAAAGGLTAIVAQTANSAREIRNLSALAGSTPQQFQKMTYAASRFGIEQDKLSDILKDTNDRIGDFIQTGGGPMADFFENIAPRVGVTAKQFERLSGPEALQLYVSSLEEANVSQKDMTFFMETIASDATALLPLLRNNGRELKKLGEEAERTGNVFSDLEFKQLEEVRRGFDELSGAATGMKNEIAFAAIPAVNDLINVLSDESTLDSARALGEAIITSMNFVINAIDGAVKVTQFLAEELAAFIHGPAFDDIPRLTERLEDLNGALEEQQERLAKLNETPNLVPKEVISAEEERLRLIKERRDATKELIESAREAQSAELGAGSGIDPVNVPELPAPAGGGIRRSSASSFESNDVRGDSILEGIDAQGRGEEIIAAQMAQAEAVKLGLDRQYRIEEEHAERVRALKAGLRNGVIESQQELDSLIVSSTEQRNNELERLEQQRQAIILAGTENLFGSLAGLAETFAGEQSALYKTMFAAQQAAAIAQSVVAINTGIAQASALPFPANLGAMATVAAATAGIVGNIEAVSLNIAGQAHDGIDSIPADGTWNLKKGERVTTAETSAKLDATLDKVARGQSGGSNVTVNLYEDASKAGQVEQRQRPDGGTDVNVFVSDIMSHGPRSKALESAYGLRRQGR